LAPARQAQLLLDDVGGALRTRLDAGGDLPAAGTLHQKHGGRIEQIRMAIAAPGEAETVVEESLAQIHDTLLAHGEQVIDEDDMPYAEADQVTADNDSVVDAGHTALLPGGG